MRRKLELAVAVTALLGAAFHLGLEIWFHRRFGQFMPNLWIHLFAAALLAVAGWRVLRAPGAMGTLCGAFGLTFGLAWWSFSTVALRLLENRVSASFVPAFQVLGLALVVALLGFAASLILSWRRSPASGASRNPGP